MLKATSLFAIIVSGIFVLATGLIGTTYAADVPVGNGESVIFDDHAISVARTNVDGDGPGNFLYLRGFDGIIMAAKGDATFGTGEEGLRIDSNGNISMANAKSLSWEDQGISITRANSDGDDVGAFLQLRGFEGIVMRTGGDGFFGSGDERVRITSVGLGIGTNPTQALDVAGNIRLTGDIVSPNDICIGTCP